MVHMSILPLATLFSLAVTLVTAVDIRVYPKVGCKGDNFLLCANVVVPSCCSFYSKAVSFKAAKAAGPGSGLDVTINLCRNRKCNKGECIASWGNFCPSVWGKDINSVYIKKTHMRGSGQRNSAEEEKCATPDSVVYVDDNGEQVMAKIPEGEFDAYAEALVKKDLGTLRKAQVVKRGLHVMDEE
ncbi:hypothetical protein BJ508DRAFT_362886 [Ascobolus immersus RN42]|uniref:Uncharacterized protein n=1 Tax=Ascobolus immersus RN42 TaxID=1160509 RepID=A0A3N4I1M3_ASCIM|nr:hypothetical protein BJ508DRAFT_362886 [Ascobolus immersus RN42]